MNLITRAARKASRAAKFHLRKGNARRLGMSYVHPGFIYRDTLDNSSVIIDVGCADDADFSLHMIDKYGLEAYGVDPTRKHRTSLSQLEEKMAGRFTHLPLAVSAKNGTITFHESANNQSGSILNDHTNVMRDAVNSYDVESVTLQRLTDRINKPQVDLIKLDLEGAEYDLLKDIKEEDLRPFRQIYIEFHHHCTSHTITETKEIVKAICAMGFDVFSLDDHNYIFYR